jgi:hypothetical protein
MGQTIEAGREQSCPPLQVTGGAKMAKYLTLGITILTFLVLLTTTAFGQFQPVQKSTTVAKPKSTPGRVLRPHLVKVKVNLGPLVGYDATVMLDIISTPLDSSVTDADREASAPTHYSWSYVGGGYPPHVRCSKTIDMQNNQYKWSQWIPLQKGVKPSLTLKGCKTDGEGLVKGICGKVSFEFKVKNSAGESNVKRGLSPLIVTESEFSITGEDLLSEWSGKVSAGPGSVCKVEKGIKRYVQGAEQLAWNDELLFLGNFGAGWMLGDPYFFATGATPVNGSKCEYELYKGKVLPERWSVVKFNSFCGGVVPSGSIKPGAYGCTILRNPQGTRDMTTKVRIWTDALKTAAVWGYFVQKGVIIKGDCRGLTGPGFPSTDQ